ncbi:unnamed protein product, partial [Sphenostylis stenocarpa]
VTQTRIGKKQIHKMWNKDIKNHSFNVSKNMMCSKGRRYIEDKYEFILINSNHKLMTNESYVLVKPKHPDLYNMPEKQLSE